MTEVRMDIDYVAKLARLKLDDQERDRYSRQLSDILSYIHKLNQLDTHDVEPTQHILGLKNVSRPDAVKPFLNTQEILEHAPAVRSSYFIVPQVIE